MSIFVKMVGAYNAPISFFVKKNNVYSAPVAIYAKVAGVYVRVDTTVIPTGNRLYTAQRIGNNAVFA